MGGGGPTFGKNSQIMSYFFSESVPYDFVVSRREIAGWQMQGRDFLQNNFFKRFLSPAFTLAFHKKLLSNTFTFAFFL